MNIFFLFWGGGGHFYLIHFLEMKRNLTKLSKFYGCICLLALMSIFSRKSIILLVVLLNVCISHVYTMLFCYIHVSYNTKGNVSVLKYLLQYIGYFGAIYKLLWWLISRNIFSRYFRQPIWTWKLAIFRVFNNKWNYSY